MSRRRASLCKRVSAYVEEGITAETDSIPADATLDFTYDGVAPPEGWGVPAVSGTIDDHKTHFIIDTGWSLPEMGVSSSVFARIQPNQNRTPVTRYFILGNSTVATIQNVRSNLGGLILVGPVLEANGIGKGKQHVGNTESDVIMGSSILQSCKVTIDYPARQIRLKINR